MRRSTWWVTVCSLLGVLSPGPGRAGHAGPDGEGLRLRTGKVLQGQVVGRERVDGQTLLRIETDFGRLLVPEGQLASQAPTATAQDTGFQARSVRVARIEGKVERRPAGAVEWSVVSFEDAYGKRRPVDEIVLAGDALRTAQRASIDLMLHKDAWVRVSEQTEVEIPRDPGRPSLQLLRGLVSQRVEGRPRGGEFRVGTPSTVLGVRGTVFVVRAGPQGESVTTARGIVSVGGIADVAAGSTGRWVGKGPVTITPSEEGERNDIPARFLHLPREDLVLVPAGRYRQGGQPSAEPDPSGAQYRRPHDRDVEEFWIGRTEVACADFELFVQATGATRPEGWGTGELPAEVSVKPVVGVGIHEARGYAAWVGCTLPTEAQWEAAARGPRGNPAPWGRESARRLRIHRPDQASGLQSVEGPTDDVSPFGCLQMASNAAELCGDYDNHEIITYSSQMFGTSDDFAVRGGFSAFGRDSSRMRSRPIGLRLARVDTARVR